MVEKIGINSQFLISLLEDVSQNINIRIPVMEIYENFILDVAKQIYLRRFENKTVM